MNHFYFFVSTDYASEPIIALYKVLRQRDTAISEIIDLTTCNSDQRDIANKFNVQSSPCLIVFNDNQEKLEQVNGPYQIFDRIDFLYSKYGS